MWNWLQVDIDQYQVSDIPHIPTLPHSTKDKWVVIKAATSPSVLLSELTDDHFSYDGITRIKLDEDRIWLVPLFLSLVKPCFVIHNKNHCEQNTENDMCDHDSTVYIMKSMNK